MVERSGLSDLAGAGHQQYFKEIVHAQEFFFQRAVCMVHAIHLDFYENLKYGLRLS